MIFFVPWRWITGGHYLHTNYINVHNTPLYKQACVPVCQESQAAATNQHPRPAAPLFLCCACHHPSTHTPRPNQRRPKHSHGVCGGWGGGRVQLHRHLPEAHGGHHRFYLRLHGQRGREFGHCQELAVGGACPPGARGAAAGMYVLVWVYMYVYAYACRQRFPLSPLASHGHDQSLILPHRAPNPRSINRPCCQANPTYHKPHHHHHHHTHSL